MDTSTSLHVQVATLERSGLPGDSDVAKQCKELLDRVIKLMLPILNYICRPTNFLVPQETLRVCKVLSFSGVRSLFVTDRGLLFSVTGEHEGNFRFSEPILNAITEGDDSWKWIPFDEVMNGLRNVLALAEESRRKHLESVASRRQALDAMMAALELAKPQGQA